ncbi:hypothetical protein BDP81DRAFT_427829 [Colletotrichum phormii]|uniref:Uncharacterized protein n=1 Tax=Colletotrichum phormii TaxID=359342 RepID=A0AAI9ZQZ0_9PEZI|nr:uncharacterized protein BDP81DRAFT_427829 [Colletotrichum phormii]KAK1636559.1 hypothetical protein BDP81DRAFT_427829 [Colletotrichum phormii]
MNGSTGAVTTDKFFFFLPTLRTSPIHHQHQHQDISVSRNRKHDSILEPVRNPPSIPLCSSLSFGQGVG